MCMVCSEYLRKTYGFGLYDSLRTNSQANMDEGRKSQPLNINLTTSRKCFCFDIHMALLPIRYKPCHKPMLWPMCTFYWIKCSRQIHPQGFDGRDENELGVWNCSMRRYNVVKLHLRINWTRGNYCWRVVDVKVAARWVAFVLIFSLAARIFCKSRGSLKFWGQEATPLMACCNRILGELTFAAYGSSFTYWVVLREYGVFRMEAV
jgi:hypothetical protein